MPAFEVNNTCFCIFLVFGVVMAGHILMFEFAEDHKIKKSFAKCITGEEEDELLGLNVTKCVSCHDKRYQLASDRDSGDEDQCDEYAILGDCCVRISFQRRTEVEAIFYCFIVIFAGIFALMHWIINYDAVDVPMTGKAAELLDSSQPLMQPQPMMVMPPPAPAWGAYNPCP